MSDPKDAAPSETAEREPTGAKRCPFTYAPRNMRAFRCRRAVGHEGNHLVRYRAGMYLHEHVYEFSQKGENLTERAVMEAMRDADRQRQESYEWFEKKPEIVAELARLRAEIENLLEVLSECPDLPDTEVVTDKEAEWRETVWGPWTFRAANAMRKARRAIAGKEGP